MRNFKCEFCGKGETCYLQMPDDKYPNYCVAEEAEEADWQEVNEECPFHSPPRLPQT